MNEPGLTYETLRVLTGTWGLVGMVIIFSAFALWPFRPGSKKSNESAAKMIFKDDDNG